ncbi:MAG TPA: hypothetical protein VFP79_07155 [Pseudolabrys sp.]|nr:hypothetical protein [Pseudolabrys sp.]
MRTAVAVAMIALACCKMAQAADVDWKFYGGASVDGDSYCFYDSKGIVRTFDSHFSHVRVWTKCLLQADLNKIDIKKDYGGQIVDSAARKMLDNYVPPVAIAKNLDADARIAVAGYEEIANISDTEPVSRIFYELDCSQRMMRELSIFVRANGKKGFRDKPRGWKHVPPEGNGTTLLKILCPQR